MSNPIVKSQVEEVQAFLEKTVTNLEGYLNSITIEQLLQERSGDRAYYEGVLSNLRRLLVYCEEGLDSCLIVTQNEPFIKGAAEKTLYKIYHQCIEEFFSPRYDLWYEDSRSAYTGKNSILFRQDLPESIIKLMAAAESDFQEIREELEYYETDFRTKIMQSRS